MQKNVMLQYTKVLVAQDNKGKDMYKNYEISLQEQFYIDKSQALEGGLKTFPSIYLEGAASSGKTTAVRMLLDKHPEVESIVIWMDDEMQRERLTETLRQIQEQEEDGCIWVIFENLPKELSADNAEQIATFIRSMPGNARVILISRDKMAVEFLDLFWKREMEIISQEILLFTKKEIRKLLENVESRLDTDEIYAVTGGWTGCVDALIRLSALPGYEKKTVRELMECYEITAYIQKVILGTLSDVQREILQCAQQCPWLNEELCKQVWNISQCQEVLEELSRKGILLYDERKKGWVLAPLFEGLHGIVQKQESMELLGHWYEQRGFVKEALECFEKARNEAAYRNCMLAHYKEIPFQGIAYEIVNQWTEDTPQICYLRGMNAYEHQRFDELNQEIQKLRRMGKAEFLQKEILLNLCYVSPEISLDDWLVMLEKEMPEKFHLYHMLGHSHMCLCGLRDLTEMFACSRKEENRKAKIWKTALGEEEMRCYHLARIDYYIETQRKDTIEQEALQILRPASDVDSLYLWLRLQPEQGVVDFEKFIEPLERDTDMQNAEALISLYSPNMQNTERFAYWMRDSEKRAKEDVAEDNYIFLYYLSKGYIMLGQYERAGKITSKLLPYLKAYRRERLVAELLFQQAIIHWEGNRHGLALQSTIESFLISREYRYVQFYASYGKKGEEVLNAYIDWMKANYPEGWKRKKKYQYGNVLRMPEADYMGVILRCMKHWHRQNRFIVDQSVKERLTMMENIILQEIGKGLTNAEICQVLNLKLPTVKAHIYNIYKKLDVGNRMQAVLRGKELGILDEKIK